LLAALLCTSGLALAQDDWVYFERAFYVMGSKLEFKLYCARITQCELAVKRAYEEAKTVDYLFSDYREDSILALVHKKGHGGFVKVPPQFIELTERSIRYSELTKGAFDITVGTLVRLWRRAQEKGQMPHEGEIKEAMKCTGYRMVRLLPRQYKVSLASPCVLLDFGAIGKGYALDRMVMALRESGVDRGIIDLGGNIFAMSPPPGEDGWVVGVRNPSKTGSPVAYVKIVNMSIATSGDYERFFEVGARRLSHILDPRTGYPAREASSVSVVSPSAVEADALSTAFSVLSEDEVAGIAEKLGHTGVFIMRNKGDGVSIFRSGVFNRLKVSATDSSVF
jgi:thiamine biosynthesis lipoprotein